MGGLQTLLVAAMLPNCTSMLHRAFGQSASPRQWR
jgi:hypothetical protein